MRVQSKSGRVSSVIRIGKEKEQALPVGYSCEQVPINYVCLNTVYFLRQIQLKMLIVSACGFRHGPNKVAGMANGVDSLFIGRKKKINDVSPIPLNIRQIVDILEKLAKQTYKNDEQNGENNGDKFPPEKQLFLNPLIFLLYFRVFYN